MYRPAGLWAWDFWLARDDRRWHLFHLQAPRTVHPDDRHWCASVGHAVSADLREWTTLPTALEPGPPGEWDDTAIWTGSIILHNSGRWMMAYTGISRRDGIATERIGLAWSDDLVTWDKDSGNPVVVSDPHRFEQPGETAWQHGWRDPFLWRNGESYQMLICARSNAAVPLDRRGVVATANSADGVSWSLGDTLPGTDGWFAQLEVPHLVARDGRVHLVFSTHTDGPWPRTEPAASQLIGTAALVADDPSGPFGSPYFIDATEDGRRYAGRIVEDPGDRSLSFLSFHDGPGHTFPGVVSDPRAVEYVDGTLRLMSALPRDRG